MDDPFDLDRFVTAQAGYYDAALGELTRGRKTSHWMWFVFPQLAGLGHSAMAQAYAIRSLSEARAYLAHPLLGTRMMACLDALLAHPDASAEAMLGETDALKLRSSLTLFAAAAPDTTCFTEALARFFGGVPDPRTVRLLG